MVAVSGVAVFGCGGSARLPVSAGMGLHPTIPPPERSLIPTIKVATAIGWPSGATPIGATGTSVNAFAVGLAHPRSLLVLPNGDAPCFINVRLCSQVERNLGAQINRYCNQ